MVTKKKTPAKKTSRKSVSKKRTTKTSYILKDGSLSDSVPQYSKFSASIKGELVSGRIYKKTRTEWYLCQDSRDGYNLVQKLGYKYSWVFNPYYPSTEGVKFLTITPDRSFTPPPAPPMLGDYSPIIRKGYIKVGCQKIPNSVVRKMVKWLKD